MRAEIRIQIHSGFSSCQTGDVWLYIPTDIPFLPIKGMELYHDDWHSWAIVCDEISGRMKESGEWTIHIYTESDKHFYDIGKDKHGILWRTTDEEMKAYIAENYLPKGWLIDDRDTSTKTAE